VKNTREPHFRSKVWHSVDSVVRIGCRRRPLEKTGSRRLSPDVELAMMNKTSRRNIRRDELIDQIAIGLSILLLISVFVIELIVPDIQANSTIKVLIEAWKVASSLSIAWFTQKYLSRLAYFGNLKERALGAYRRISDIQKSVDMLGLEITQMNGKAENINKTQLRGVQFGVELIKVTVLSSIADWTDVIGEDLVNKEKLENLQKMERSIETGLPNDGEESKAKKLDEIRKEINDLRETLPYLLRFENLGLEDDYPRGGRVSPLITQFFLSSLRANKAIYLTLEAMGVHEGDFSDLTKKEPFTVSEDVAAGTSHLVVHDSSGEWIGEVINPFDQVYTRDFIVSLEEALSIAGAPSPTMDSQ